MVRSQTRRPPAVALAAGVALLALVWVAGPRGQPPLYDSTLGPAEPYRYCQPPQGFRSKTPLRIDRTVSVANGVSPALAEVTQEQPPQAQLLAPANALAVPPGATFLHVTVECAPPPAVLPLDGGLDGNVYAFTVAAGAGVAEVRPGQQVTVVLRGPAGVPSPILERFAAGQWMKLDTQPLGNTSPDSYAANVTGLGDIALVVLNSVVPAADGGTHTGLIVVLVIVAVALFAAGAVLSLRGRSGGG